MIDRTLKAPTLLLRVLAGVAAKRLRSASAEDVRGQSRRRLAGTRLSVRRVAMLLAAVLATFVALPVESVFAGAGNSAYRGLSSQPPTGYLPSPQFYDLSKGQSTLTFNFTVTNPSSSAVSLPLNLILNHIVTYNFHDVSTGQPGVPLNQVLVTDSGMNVALAIQVQVSSSPYLLSIAPNTTKTFTASAALPGCGFFQFDIRSPLDGNGHGLEGGVIRVLGCEGTPTISTSASPSAAPVGTPIHDTAVVSGGEDPTGTVSFSLHAPGDLQCFGPDLVAGLPGFKNLPFIAGQSVTSAAAVTTHVGTYRWVATYSGDPGNRFASSGCGSELVTVTTATPSIATTPTQTGSLMGASISDTATLGGGYSATGTVSFSLFGPADRACSGTDLVAGLTGFKNIPLVGVSAKSAGFVPTQPGTYEWVATYSGDKFNSGAVSACGSESATLTPLPLPTPSLLTVPSSGGPAGTVISDVATLRGGEGLGGTVSFALYGPGDSGCSGPNLVASLAGFTAVPLVDMTSHSAGFAAQSAGTYRWVATYSGDSHYQGVTGGCSDELVTMTKATPTMSTIPSVGGVLGTAVHDQVLVKNGSSPTGTVSFSLYGPNDPNCTGADLVSNLAGFKNVSLDPTGVSSASFTPTQAGTYDWMVSYSGDGSNTPVAIHGCGVETVAITKLTPTISTTTTPAIGVVGMENHDAARLSGGFDPTGTVSFSLYGPGDLACSGPDLVAGAASFKNIALSPDGAVSPDFTVTAVGTYNWVATYNGDANNSPVSSPCGAEPVTTGEVLGATSTSAPPLADTGDVDMAIGLLGLPLLAFGMVFGLAGLALRRRS